MMYDATSTNPHNAAGAASPDQNNNTSNNNSTSLSSSKGKRHNPYAAVTPPAEAPLSPPGPVPPQAGSFASHGMTPPQGALGNSFGSPVTPPTAGVPAGAAGFAIDPMTPPTPPPSMSYVAQQYQAMQQPSPVLFPGSFGAPGGSPATGAAPAPWQQQQPPLQLHPSQQQSPQGMEAQGVFGGAPSSMSPYGAAPNMAAAPAGGFAPYPGAPGFQQGGMPMAPLMGQQAPMAHHHHHHHQHAAGAPAQPPQQQREQGGGHHHHGGNSHHGGGGSSERKGRGSGGRHQNHHNDDEGTGPAATGGSFSDVLAMQGSLLEHARTASGSSCIQAALKDTTTPDGARSLELIWGELAPSVADLVLDAHGCYVVKSLLDRLPAADLQNILRSFTEDEQLGFSICTHSLHTRRVVQHIIENIDGQFVCELMSRRCAEVAMTQQGCIVMQRSMDHARGPAHDALLAAICKNVVGFARDPFANYVVQHLMEVGDREVTSAAIWEAAEGKVVELACNKFASNVIEKCLFHVTAKVQHEILTELYSAGPQTLFNMLQDSFGNYIIQSSIALATFRDVSFIDEKLRPVLSHTPYGHKIEARLDRRLKGKPVTARSPLLPHQGRRAAAPRKSENHQAPATSVPEGEVPW